MNFGMRILGELLLVASQGLSVTKLPHSVLELGKCFLGGQSCFCRSLVKLIRQTKLNQFLYLWRVLLLCIVDTVDIRA